MMSKLGTKKTAMLKMVFTAHLAIILALVISISIREKLIAQEFTNETKEQISESDSVITIEPVYTVVTKMPGYPGGDKAYQRFLSKNIKYPEEALKNGISGTVYLSFIVEKDGKVSNVKLLRGIGGGCDKEAMRVVSLFPDYEPGLDEDGKPVRTVFNIPISFKLDNGKKDKKEDKSSSGPPPPYKK